ncbi:MAG: hypothetical protein ACYCUV_15290 [Phycisphaerae bacterium]
MTDLNTDESNLPLLLRHRWPEWLGFGSLLLALVYFVGHWCIQGIFLDTGMFSWLPAQSWIKSHPWWLLRLLYRWEYYGPMIYVSTLWIAFTMCYLDIVRHVLDKSKCGSRLWWSAAAAAIGLLLTLAAALTGRG